MFTYGLDNFLHPSSCIYTILSPLYCVGIIHHRHKTSYFGICGRVIKIVREGSVIFTVFCSWILVFRVCKLLPWANKFIKREIILPPPFPSLVSEGIVLRGSFYINAKPGAIVLFIFRWRGDFKLYRISNRQFNRIAILFTEETQI